MVDSVPDHLVVPAGRHASPNCEDQFAVECLFQQFQHLVSLSCVRKIGGSVGAVESNLSSFAGIHRVVNDNGARTWKAVAVHQRLHLPHHFSGRLVANHDSVDAGANWAFDPVILALEHVEAGPVDDVTAGQDNHVLV